MNVCSRAHACYKLTLVENNPCGLNNFIFFQNLTLKIIVILSIMNQQTLTIDFRPTTKKEKYMDRIVPHTEEDP